MANIVLNIRSLQAGIQSALDETWRQKFPIYQKLQGLLLRMLPFINLRQADYVWKESVPFPEPWEYGTPRSYKTFQDRKIRLGLYPYQLNIPFSGWDELGDQLGDLRSHIGMSAQRFLQLPDKLLAEYFNGVRALNYVLHNCYDGVGLFSAVDGDGNNRFGVVGGNLLVGSGVTEAAISEDFADVQKRFLQFLDPSGESPIFSEEDVAYDKMVAIIPPNLNEVFQKLTKAEMLRISPDNDVSESNWLKGTFEYRINQYLTDPLSWYIVVNHPYWKPFAYRGPGKDGLRHIFQDFRNSDRAREFNENASLMDIRVGIGPWSPFSVVKIENN